MTEQIRDPLSGAVSRRDALKRGAIAGGTLLWATPIVQTIGMTPALAQVASPVVNGPALSFIALNVTCNGDPFFIKYEVTEGAWDPEPGAAPFCECHFCPEGESADGGFLGFGVTGPNEAGCFTVTVPANCTVVDSAVMGGTVCCQGPVPPAPMLFCPPDCTPCPPDAVCVESLGNGNGNGNGNKP